ncbi:MAG TPA: ROK family protein [Chloroflexota bacterium]|nr:ROK family protein [Chloroflexota bacterium]
MSRYLGLDLGGTRMRAALAGHDGSILCRAGMLTQRREGSQRLIRQIFDIVEQAKQGAEVACIGVGAPGPLDANTGVLYHPPNFTNEDIPLKKLLEDRFGIPACVQNDANVAALGECRFGGHGPTQHLIYLTVSTGVGAGIISNSRLIDGFNTTAGEIGHTIIDPDGPECPAGHQGCVEIICSGTSIARAAREALAARRQSTLDPDRVTAELVAKAAQDGDPLASAVFFHAADMLGIAVVNLIHLLSPEVVVIGGGVAQAGELLFGPVRDRVRRNAMASTTKGVRIVPPGLGQDAGLVGAITLAMRQSNAQEAKHGT